MATYDEDDQIEIGDLIPISEGWFKDARTGELITPTGKVYESPLQELDEEIDYDADEHPRA